MTILITGASGYVTAAVAADLAHDHAVRLVGRRPPAARLCPPARLRPSMRRRRRSCCSQ